MKKLLKLNVNGRVHPAYVEPWRTLLEVLRDELALTGTKMGCESGHCGACTVLIDGKAVKSCLILAYQVRGKKILTIEGLAGSGTGSLHPLQQSFLDHFAIQCGFCTPGMVMSATALLDENPEPSEDEIRKALTGNICRCTGYTKVVEAIMAARRKIS
ncbi:MAG: (2Fe-2S)-binding protein [Chloroflexi bacterium]|nr:(2Fe-2S)-binding protein [Chloroflexota bacterium]